MKLRFIIFILLIINNSFAVSSYSTIESGVTLYSEYYPNPKAKFNGTIVFENGSGTALDEWTQNREFFNCIKQYASVFLYDRNGLGKSPPDLHLSNSNPITAKFMSDKLYKLLKQQHVKPPYIIVAHSYGAIYAGYFILDHTSLVQSVLLVDPVPRDFHFSTALINSHESAIIAAKTKPSLFVYKNHAAEAEVAYQLLGFEEAKQQLAQLGSINNKIPVVILSSDDMEYKVKPLKEDWYNSQKQWLNSNIGSKIFVEKSNHFIQLQKPKAVCKQIENLISN